MIEQKAMTGTIHRLQREDLLLDLRREHILRVVLSGRNDDGIDCVVVGVKIHTLF